MGNYTPQSRQAALYQRVSDLPEGLPPPSFGALQTKVKEVATYASQRFDPVSLSACRTCLSRSPLSETAQREHLRLREQLSTFAPEQPAFSEQTFTFTHPGSPAVWLSSTKNSDHTVSYWLQYPITPFHIQAAFLQALDLPVTAENLAQIVHRFPAEYQQLLRANRNEVAVCEQTEPLYLDLCLKALLAAHYRPHRKGRSAV